jgi:energy-converting hydrogenase Eha subunit H
VRFEVSNINHHKECTILRHKILVEIRNISRQLDNDHFMPEEKRDKLKRRLSELQQQLILVEAIELQEEEEG